MTQSFDTDPVRLSHKEAHAVLERLGAPLADYWTVGKALLWLLVVAVAALVVFVCFILWGVSQPRARAALPDGISQIRLSYVGPKEPRTKQVISNELLLTGTDAQTISAIANGALTRKTWHQIIRGGGACELQLRFQDSNAHVRRTLSVEQVGDGLLLYDNKWQQPVQGMDPVRFLAVVPQSRLSAMRREACGS